MTEGSITCPDCRQVDSVQKVSSVVTGGTSSHTHEGTTSGVSFSRGGMGSSFGSATLHGGSSTALARRLSLPTEPPPRSAGGMTWTGVVLLLLGGFFAWGASSMLAGGAADASGPAIIGVVGLLAGASLLIVGLIRWWRYQEYCNTVAHPLWQHMRERWNGLFYCAIVATLCFTRRSASRHRPKECMRC